MKDEDLTIRISDDDIDCTAEVVRTYHMDENGMVYCQENIEDAIRKYLELRVDRIVEDLDDVLTTPNLAEFREFNRILAEETATAPAAAEAEQAAVGVAAAASSPATNVFSGRRTYSPERLGAMIRYFAAHGKDVFRTKLNKLLFYADLRFYARNGIGISGATYVNLPYGPVADGVTRVVDELIAAGDVEFVEVKDGAGRFVADPDAADFNELSEEERRELDAVLERYGDLSTSEIVDLSHEEMAYKYTRPGEPIAYEYGKFLKK